MHRTHKPVRKCHGCPLNLGPRCAIYECPHDQWHDRAKCPDYMNEALAEELDQRVATTTPDHASVDRRSTMKLTKTVPHYQGNRDPKRRVG